MEKIYAFIDSQNLNLAVQKSGWRLDFRKFRIYLKDKYKVEKAFLFLGYVSDNQRMYFSLKRQGYELVFRPTLRGVNGVVKGNCDVDLTVKCMDQINNFDKAIIISGDGDFHGLIKYLERKNKLLAVGITNSRCYSALLRRFSKYLFFINLDRKQLEYKKREASWRKD